MNEIKVIIESGAIKRLPEVIKTYKGTKPFVLSGQATYAAAGEQVIGVLREAKIDYTLYQFSQCPVEPTEYTVGSAVMHFDYSCDVIIGIGSGVINDTGKILSKATGRPYIIVGTAPSMDGYASATSSMERDGLKVSIDSRMPDAIIGDLDILANAPLHMLRAGIGDMLAKYISLVEWKLASIIVGEEYQDDIAELVQKAVKKVVDAANRLMVRDREAVADVMEGLIIAGMAMKTAGCSRPASGMEHYYSHIWDMRSLAFPEAKADLHGIQCGIATLLCLKDYEKIRRIAPDREMALQFVQNFDVDDWNKELKDYIGPGADAMILGEQKEGKYEVERHKKRLDHIIAHWDEILAVIDTLPTYSDIYQLIKGIGAPTSPDYLGYEEADIYKTMTMTKDIRDKYIGSRLLWDLGEL